MGSHLAFVYGHVQSYSLGRVSFTASCTQRDWSPPSSPGNSSFTVHLGNSCSWGGRSRSSLGLKRSSRSCNQTAGAHSLLRTDPKNISVAKESATRRKPNVYTFKQYAVLTMTWWQSVQRTAPKYAKTCRLVGAIYFTFCTVVLQILMPDIVVVPLNELLILL